MLRGMLRLMMILALVAVTSGNGPGAMKVRENRVRRLARRRGWTVAKKRRMDRSAADYGQWIIRDAAGALVLVGALDAAERLLAGDEPNRTVASGDVETGALVFPREGSAQVPILVSRRTSSGAGVMGRGYLFTEARFSDRDQLWRGAFWGLADEQTRRAFGLDGLVQLHDPAAEEW